MPVPHDVFLADSPIVRLETAPKSLKLLTLQVRTQPRKPQLEPCDTSKLQIISAPHSYFPTRFPCRSNCRTTSQHPETLQTVSRLTVPNEQMSDTKPAPVIPGHAAYHFLLLLLTHLPLPITSPLLPLARLYTSQTRACSPRPHRLIIKKTPPINHTHMSSLAIP